MSKSNKELAVEMVIAFINANPTQPSAGDSSIVKRFIDPDSICKVLPTFYAALQSLDSNTPTR